MREIVIDERVKTMLSDFFSSLIPKSMGFCAREDKKDKALWSKKKRNSKNIHLIMSSGVSEQLNK